MPVPITLPDLALAIGLMGTLSAMSWPLPRSRTGMLALQVSTTGLFCLHYALIGAWTGCAINALAMVQCLAAIPLGTLPQFRFVYLATLPLLAVIMAVTWQGWPSVFSTAGMALMSIGRYQLDVVRFRSWFLVALPCWFGHNFLVGSLPGMIADTTSLTANAVMLGRELARRRAARPAAAPS